MKKLANVKKYLPVALALAAFAVAGGTASAFAQAFSGSYGTGNVLPFEYAPSTIGSGAYAQAPATIDHRAAHRTHHRAAHRPMEVAPAPR